MTYILVLFLGLYNCNPGNPKTFSEEALNDIFITMDGKNVKFKDILEENKGKTIVIDVWASWCRDCIVGMPKVKALQEEFKDIVYVFLSLDRSEEAWKKGIEKYDVIGGHYFMKSGRKGPFGSFMGLDWIPRYAVIAPNGKIKVFKVIEADDNKLIKALK